MKKSLDVILRLVAIVGMPGAGKSVAAEFFRSQGLPVLRFGDQVDLGLSQYKKPRNEKNERWYREKLRQDLGMAAMAIKIEPRIRLEAKRSSKIILDGLYSWEEYLYLKGKFPQIFVLCIYAPPQIRFARLAVRPIRPLTEFEAISRDISEIENLHKGGPIAIADYLIKNDGSEENFHKELSKFYKTHLI